MNASLAQLHTLANLYGVRTAFLDMNNQTRSASVESLVAALKVLASSICRISFPIVGQRYGCTL